MTGSVGEIILQVFTAIFTWLISSLESVVGLFWDSGDLTFFGVLAVFSLGISIFFLLVRVVQNFLHFRS